VVQIVLQSVDVLMPVHGKAETIRPTLERVTQTLGPNGRCSFRFVIVLDGPDEACRREIREFPDPRISLIELSENRGKGAALRAACSDLQGSLTVFMDADLDIDPSAALDGISVLTNGNSKSLACVYGSKLHPESQVIYPFRRRMLSSIFRRYVRVLLKLDVEDTQTGIKVFRTDHLLQVIDKCAEQRFLFDVELLTLLAWNGRTFAPTPVKIDYAFNSSIKIRDIIIMGIDALQLAYRMRIQRKQLMGINHE
jgi:dolichol-phosphate mannosyltransferase